MVHLDNQYSLMTILLLTMMELSSGATTTTYRAAVYEHALIPPPFSSLPVTRQTALEHMDKNLAIFQVQTAEARQQGADIMVLPEHGLYGYNWTRAAILPYLEVIPDPEHVTWSPCREPDVFPDTQVQRALSCMAMENSIYLVASMGDKQPCDPQLDNKCPHEGHYQYNTAVAYGPDGSLLVKYHKTHLDRDGHFDSPTPEVKYFDTPFGRFGLLVCYDLLFYAPTVVMVTKHKVDNMAVPVAWQDSLPLLSAVGYHSSLARGLDVNLLVANVHVPRERFHGSGVYTPRGMAAFYYSNFLGSMSRLVLTDVEVLGARRHRNEDRPCGGDGVRTRKCREFDRTSESERSAGAFSSSETRQPSSRQRRETIFKNKDFLFLPLTGKSPSALVCSRTVCCHLDYSFPRDLPPTELFALGVYDGLFHGKYYVQVCTVLKCPSHTYSSCGSETLDSSTRFTTLTLSAQLQTEHVYPQVILSNHGQLELAPPRHWLYRNMTLTVSPSLTTPILSVTLLGRGYDRDKEDKSELKALQKPVSVYGQLIQSGVLSGLSVVTVLALLLLILRFFNSWSGRRFNTRHKNILARQRRQKNKYIE